MELMVAMAVTLIVTGASTASSRAAKRLPPRAGAHRRQQNIRIAMDMIQRDIADRGRGMPAFIQAFRRPERCRRERHQPGPDRRPGRTTSRSSATTGRSPDAPTVQTQAAGSTSGNDINVLGGCPCYSGRPWSLVQVRQRARPKWGARSHPRQRTARTSTSARAAASRRPAARITSGPAVLPASTHGGTVRWTRTAWRPAGHPLRDGEHSRRGIRYASGRTRRACPLMVQTPTWAAQRRQRRRASRTCGPVPPRSPPARRSGLRSSTCRCSTARQPAGVWRTTPARRPLAATAPLSRDHGRAHAARARSR